MNEEDDGLMMWVDSVFVDGYDFVGFGFCFGWCCGGCVVVYCCGCFVVGDLCCLSV